METSFGKDVLQARILAELFRDSVRGNMAVKGGMAMRAAYGSMRFTKDIDIAANAETMSPARVKASIGDAIRTALRKAKFVSDATVSTPKMTDTTQRWKIAGTIGGTRFNLTVECSRRDRLPQSSIRQVEWQPDSEETVIKVDVYHIDLMTASKVSCLCSPVRDAPRDVFDLGILIELSAEPPIELIRRIGRAGLEKGLAALWDKLDSMDWERAKNEILPFMPQAAVAALDAATWETTRLMVGEKVEAWLQAALDEKDGAVPKP